MNIINDLLNDNNKTVDDLAIYLNLKIPTKIYNWKNNLYDPNIEALIKVADYFGCSLDYLLCRTENNEEIKTKKLLPFGTNLKKLINSKHKTIFHVAKDLRLNEHRLRKHIKENKYFKTATLIKLADYLGVSLDELVGRM